MGWPGSQSLILGFRDSDIDVRIVSTEQSVIVPSDTELSDGKKAPPSPPSPPSVEIDAGPHNYPESEP